jgi:putative 4-mercaptohistidine N1-methyltranferase
MTPASGQNYEDDALLSAYLLFHYGSTQQIREGSHAAKWIPDEALQFPLATVWSTFEDGDADKARVERALDIGCAVGRSTFELANLAEEVIGVDFSDAFISAASRLLAGETLRCRRSDEGHRARTIDIAFPPAAELADGRVHFEVGDAMNLRPHLGSFDLVHAANLLCRLPNPRAFLKRLPDLVRPGGQLVLATPCSWLTEFTPQEEQPDADSSTLDFLHRYLSDSFEFCSVAEIPFAIREHARKFQLSTSQTSVWRRK